MLEKVDVGGGSYVLEGGSRKGGFGPPGYGPEKVGCHSKVCGIGARFHRYIFFIIFAHGDFL